MKPRETIILLLMLQATSFLSYKPLVDNPAYPIVSQVLGYVLIVYCFGTIVSNKKDLTFKGGNIWVMASFFTGVLSSYILYGQSFYESFKAIGPMLMCVGLYFLCIKWGIRESYLLKCLIGISLVFTFFEVLQQFTYPTMWFNGRAANEITSDVEQRMGLWRFYIFGIDYCLLACLFAFQMVMQKRNVRKNLILLVATFVGIVFFVARKNIYATLSCFFIGLIFSNKKSSVSTRVLVCLLLVAAIMILPDYMEDLNTQTSEELGSSDFIRFVAAEYYINLNDSPLYVLFGSGLYGGSSTLAKLIEHSMDALRLFKSDCGFVGYYSDFGLFGIGAMVYIVYKIVKNYKYIDLYLILYLILRLETSFFDFWGNSTRNMAAWCIYLYLMECSIQRNKGIIAGKKTNIQPSYNIQ